MPTCRAGRMHPALAAARVATGSAISEQRSALAALKAHLVAPLPGATAPASQRAGEVLTLLLAACSHSPQCCRAAAVADLPQVHPRAALFLRALQGTAFSPCPQHPLEA